MKKFLSLVLALVMTMSLVTISAGAKDFTDGSKITYKEAVDVISELDIVDGYSAGDFRPANTLTRGAAAKIICNMVLGPTTADALSASTAPFKDVPADSTFAGYITYCAKEGIINGYADGTFRPSATLNGYAFMKMLLGALGYDAAEEQFTGANWSVNVAKLAIGIDLNDGLTETFNGSKAVTREEACLYALNTLQATMVEYGSKTTVTVNGAQVVVGGNDAKDMANTSSSEGNIKKDTLMQFAEKYFTNLKLKSNEDDAFGRPCNQWKIKNDEIGKYAKTADATYTKEVAGEDLRADLGDNYKINTTKKNDEDKEVPAYYVDGDTVVLPEDFAIEKNNDDAKIGGNGVLTEAYIIEGKDNDPDTVRIVSINTYLAQVSGDYDKDDEELDLTDVNGTIPADVKMTLSSDDFDNLDAYEDEDYVLVTVDVAKDEIKSIASAEKVTAAVTSYTTGSSVTAGGTKYEYNATYNDGDGRSDYSIKDEYDLYLDAYGYVIYADGVEDDSKYVYVDDFYMNASDSNTAAVKANAYFLDGTNEEITLEKIGTTSVKGTQGLATANSKLLEGTGAWFSYTVKNSGKYTLKAADGNTLKKDYTANTEVTKDDSVYVVGASKVKANSATVFVIVDKNDDVTVYTGIKKVPEITAGADTIVAISEKDGYAKRVFIDLGKTGESEGGSSSTDVIFVYKTKADVSTDEDENTYYTYKAVLNTETTKVNFADDALDTYLDDSGKLAKGLYVNVSYDDSTKYVSSAQILDDAYVAKHDDDFDIALSKTGEVEFKNDVLSIGDASFYMASGAKVFVASGSSDLDTYTAKALANKFDVKSGDDATNWDIYGVKNADGDFSALYIVK